VDASSLSERKTAERTVEDCHRLQRLDRAPSLFDGLILGTARLKDAKVVTADPHFKDLPETIWI
jgi:predicted nucleic acid-binding protein